MILIDGDPGFSTDVSEWESWLTHLTTDPFFIQHACDESVIMAIEHAQNKIEFLQNLELEEKTRPTWIDDLNQAAGINQNDYAFSEIKKAIK